MTIPPASSATSRTNAPGTNAPRTNAPRTNKPHTNELRTNAPSTNQPRTKICESCGRVFVCHAGGCWCDSVPLDPAALSALRAKYRDCLCEPCLKSSSRGVSKD